MRLSDLSRDDQARLLDLDPLLNREEFNAFWTLVSRLKGRQLTDVQAAAANDLSDTTRQVLLRINNFGVSTWSVWTRDDEVSLAERFDSDSRGLVMDLSGFERQAERSAVALATLRQLWTNRESRQPVLLVIDEAHNICPAVPTDSIQQALTDLVVMLAGEGRKYGLYLLLSTQRPDKLHPNVISQCDNLLLMLMNSQADLETLGSIFSFVPADMLAESVSFRQGEALIAGKIVNAPMLVKMGQRLSREGGADVPTTWASVAITD